jgi:hypothetical protein
MSSVSVEIPASLGWVVALLGKAYLNEAEVQSAAREFAAAIQGLRQAGVSDSIILAAAGTALA